MNYIISGKNIEITESLREAVEKKLGKLERYFAEDTKIYVTLTVEKGRQKVEITIPLPGRVIRTEQVSNDMYVSIDLAQEVIERQLRRYKSKLIDGHQAAGSFRKEYIERDFGQEDGKVDIMRKKKYDIKPMYPEDAAIQMELVGHEFFVFVNAETDETNVIYRRKGGTYGLLEPDNAE